MFRGQYWPVRRALLATLPATREGLSIGEATRAVARKVPRGLFPNETALRWGVRGAVGELARRGVVQRVPGSARLRRAQ